MTGYDLAQTVREKLPEAKVLFAPGYIPLIAQDGDRGTSHDR